MLVSAHHLTGTSLGNCGPGPTRGAGVGSPPWLCGPRLCRSGPRQTPRCALPRSQGACRPSRWPRGRSPHGRAPQSGPLSAAQVAPMQQGALGACPCPAGAGVLVTQSDLTVSSRAAEPGPDGALHATSRRSQAPSWLFLRTGTLVTVGQFPSSYSPAQALGWCDGRGHPVDTAPFRLAGCAVTLTQSPQPLSPLSSREEGFPGGAHSRPGTNAL